MTGLPDPRFWAGKTVLLTGHTGFKGGWLAFWLERLGATVIGFALAPETSPSLFSLAGLDRRIDSRIGDIRDATKLAALVEQVRPDVVLHLAAQPLVRTSYAAPLETFHVNTLGTANLLDAIRDRPSVRVVLTITTDKVYHNHEWAYPYRETDRLGGHDPYSASKAAAELVVASYRSAFLTEQGVRVATARAGNVIGGGDWSADRLIPDAVRAWQAGVRLSVRRPGATRPWQHVLDPLAGYLILAEALWHRADLPPSFNFGPDASGTADVRTVIDLARAAYGKGEVAYGDGDEGPHEAGLLALDVNQARAVLGVAPRWPLDEAVARTMQWYKACPSGADASSLCVADIDAFGRSG